MTVGYAIGILLVAYILGSIPTGFWLVKALKGVDIRTIGSGSTGATNVLRAAGKGAGVFVLVADVFKGYVAVALAGWLESTWSGLPFAQPYMIPAFAGLFAIIGHSRSIFLKFTGGKSAATTLGALLGMQAVGGLLTFGTWILLVATTKIVSLASIIAAISCPIWMYLVQSPPAVVAFSMAACVFVIVRHRANITRLLNGTEPKIGSKSKTAAGAPGGAQPEATEQKQEST